MTTTLRATLTTAVEMSKTDINVADRLHTMLAGTNDWREQQQIRNAIRFAEKNAAKM